MELRMGPEVGLKKAAAYEPPKIKLTENPANLPNSDFTNRQAEQNQRGSDATRATDVQDRFQVLGNSINIQA
jgi:hypothetical protein